MLTKELTKEKVRELNYVDFISLLKETNRPPGGKQTVQEWIKYANITSSSRVLEIGSNTGFTSLELARVTGCKVIGIDVNENAINEAILLLNKDEKKIQNLVEFKLGDALSIPC